MNCDYFLFAQIRERLPHLKAIVQYKGKLSQDYPDTYDVSFICGFILELRDSKNCHAVGPLHGTGKRS